MSDITNENTNQESSWLLLATGQRSEQIAKVNFGKAGDDHICPTHALTRSDTDRAEAARYGCLDSSSGIFDDDAIGRRQA